MADWTWNRRPAYGCAGLHHRRRWVLGQLSYWAGSTGMLDHVVWESGFRYPTSLSIGSSAGVSVKDSVFNNGALDIWGEADPVFSNSQFIQTLITVRPLPRSRHGGGAQGSPGGNYFQFDPSACASSGATCAPSKMIPMLSSWPGSIVGLPNDPGDGCGHREHHRVRR